MKSPYFLLLLMAAGISCGNTAMAKNETNQISPTKYNEREFSEERRANNNIVLKEYSIIKTFEETLDLYTKLEDKKFSRSAPIPTLFDNEFFIVLKPKLKEIEYGDIEISKIEEDNTVLNIYYKEINNQEYLLNKQKNPIVILRLNGSIPSSVKLTLIKIKNR